MLINENVSNKIFSSMGIDAHEEICYNSNGSIKVNLSAGLPAINTALLGAI